MGESYRLTGGRVYTGAREVEALVVEEGRVVAAGSDAEARRAASTGTERIDLAGGIVLPGLIDAHLHLGELTRVREGLNLRELRSIPDLAARLVAWAADHPPGPITGDGWSVEQFVEGREPTAADLDRAVPDRPVVLYHASGHAAVANRAALEAAAYVGPVPDPPGGRLGRLPDGTPSGLVYESALAPLRRLTAVSPDVGALGRSVRALNALGVTAVATLNTGPEEWRAIRAALGDGTARLRVRGYARISQRDEFAAADWSPPDSEAPLALVGVKAFVDGAFGPRTAWLEEPYAGSEPATGVPVLRAHELREFLARCATEGRQPAVHAIGDRALLEVLRALEEIGARTPPNPRIEHASLVPPAFLPMLDRLRPTLVVQPGFVWSDAWLEDRLGPARARWAYPFRSLTARGHRLAGSTDAPYDPPDPWRGLAAAVHRTAPGGGSANPAPEEALAAPEALALFGAHAGRALGLPRLGVLEAGHPADLVILDATDSDSAIRLGGSCVRETWVAGTVVHRRPDARDPTTI